MTYSAKPITARVVDAQTKEPLEGVVVVAHWELQGGLEGRYRQGDITVLEAVTDSSGTFRFPGWGPKKIRRGRPVNARLQELDPEMLFFKNGYRFMAVHNYKHTDAQMAESLRFSDYDGQTIEMKKFEGTLSEYARDLAQREGLLLDPLFTACEWRQLPLLLEALGQQQKAFEVAGLGNIANSYNVLLLNEAAEEKAGCGSVHTFIEEHVH
jgi:hypothetical protein